jgi:hypothetical protein
MSIDLNEQVLLKANQVGSNADRPCGDLAESAGFVVCSR